MWPEEYDLQQAWEIRTRYEEASTSEREVMQFTILLAIGEVAKQQRGELRTIRKLLWGIWIFLAGNALCRIVASLIPPNWHGP